MQSRLRRLHVLSGAVALGAFLAFHLLTNASAVRGQGSWLRVVGRMERSPVFAALELLVVGVPLLFHLGYGAVLWRRKDETAAERHGGARRLLLQRLTGLGVLLLLAAHVWELRLQHLEPAAMHTALVTHLSWTWAGVPLVALLYLVGLVVTCFHFGHGLVAALALLRPELPRAQATRTAAVLASAFFLVGAVSVVALATGTRLLPAPDDDSGPCGSAPPSSK